MRCADADAHLLSCSPDPSAVVAPLASAQRPEDKSRRATHAPRGPVPVERGMHGECHEQRNQGLLGLIGTPGTFYLHTSQNTVATPRG